MISASIRVTSNGFLFYKLLSGFYVFWQCPVIRIRTFCKTANAKPSRLRHQSRRRVDERLAFHPLSWLVHTSRGSEANTAVSIFRASLYADAMIKIVSVMECDSFGKDRSFEKFNNFSRTLD